VDAGLVARVLGPPTDRNLVAQMSNKAQEYLRVAGDDAEVRRLRPFDEQWHLRSDAYPDSPDEVGKLVDRVQPDALLAAAKSADNAINNQSLVVHLTFDGKNLLFVGDAQWGNWESFLFGKAVGSPDTAQLQAESRDILGAVDFYKVGHHGSTNSTPIAAVKALGDHCVAMCSTEPDQYGSLENRSEVPRGALLEALAKKTRNRLVRSDQISAGTARPTKGLSRDLPSHFTTPGELYIDLSF
jgi:hypothetical protein